MALRTLDTLTVQEYSGTRTYSTPEVAGRYGVRIAESIRGLVAVRLTPVYAGGSEVRWTPVFFAFSDETDIAFIAHKGYICHR